ncbi:MAG: MarR family transcriptional regulator [Actinomycetes bacterium]|nr:MarR family transcriptional regulator [Actinomycetes bacterium]
MDDVTVDLYEKLAYLQRLLQVRKLRTHRAAGVTADPTRGQGRVLALLKLQPEITSRDLAYLLGIRPASLNELLGKLEKGGFITRRPDQNDRRLVMVQLTDKGRAQEQDRPDEDSLFAPLSDAEQQTLGGYLDRMIAALEDEMGEIPQGMGFQKHIRKEMAQIMRKEQGDLGRAQLVELLHEQWEQHGGGAHRRHHRGFGGRCRPGHCRSAGDGSPVAGDPAAGNRPAAGDPAAASSPAPASDPKEGAADND